MSKKKFKFLLTVMENGILENVFLSKYNILK